MFQASLYGLSRVIVLNHHRYSIVHLPINTDRVVLTTLEYLIFFRKKYSDFSHLDYEIWLKNHENLLIISNFNFRNS